MIEAGEVCFFCSLRRPVVVYHRLLGPRLDLLEDAGVMAWRLGSKRSQACFGFWACQAKKYWLLYSTNSSLYCPRYSNLDLNWCKCTWFLPLKKPIWLFSKVNTHSTPMYYPYSEFDLSQPQWICPYRIILNSELQTRAPHLNYPSLVDSDPVSSSEASETRTYASPQGPVRVHYYVPFRWNPYAFFDFND